MLTKILIIAQTVPQVPLPPGYEVCDQRITAGRLTVFGVAVAGIILLLALLWINSAAEAGLTSLSRFRLQDLRERHERRSRLVEELLERPARLTSTINLLNVVCLMFITALAILAIHQFNLYGPEVTAMVIVLTFITLSLSRVVPKGYATYNPEGAVLRFSGFLNAETKVVGPVVNLVHATANFVLRQAKIPPLPPNTITSEEEMSLLANIGEEEGVIEADEREMIRGVFQFGDMLVREVMHPRLDIKAVPATASLAETLEMINSSGNSRLPVYQPDLDHILGILYAKDLLRYLGQANEQPFSLQTLLRPAYYVPESKKVDQLFAELQKQRVHIAIVVDEYGGTAGLVTIEDLLEEIVGEIQDEYDVGEMAEFERVSTEEVLVEARLSLGDVNDFFQTEWESEDVETIGGFVYDRLGRIPAEGDEFLVDRAGHVLIEDENGQPTLDPERLEGPPAENTPEITDYYRITVIKVSGQRLRQLRLQHLVANPPTEATPAETSAPALPEPTEKPPPRLKNNQAPPLLE